MVAISRRADALRTLCRCLLLSLTGAAAQADDSALLHAAAAMERARPPARRFERSAFLTRPGISLVTLAPDGSQVAYLHEDGSNRGVLLRGTADGAPRRLLAHSEARSLYWSHDGRWLLLESPRELFALAVAGQAGSGIVTTLGGREQRRVKSVDPVDPAAVLLLERTRAARDTPARWRLLRVDMHGKRTLLHEDQHQITDVALDKSGRLAFLARVEDEQVAIYRTDGRKLQEVASCVRMHRCSMLPVVNHAGELLLHGDLGGNLSALLRMDAKGVGHVLHVDPRGDADLDEIVLDPVTQQPLIASYRSTVAANYGLTPEAQLHVERLARRLPGRDLRIRIGRGVNARWLINERSSTLQGERWRLYDPRTKTLRLFLDDAPLAQRSGKPAERLPESALARKIPFAYRVTDGMRLHGFLTLPPGADPTGTPLVVNVHGGPWNHARPEYSTVVQFLANRGYAVFEPNFRGSTGHGRDHVFAAHGDYGAGRVQQDIVEGVRYLVGQGIGDANRVAITGGSFGGYATLLGMTFQPELFKVGVAAVPIPDFASNLRWIARSSEALNLASYLPFKTQLRMLSLDIDDHAAMARLRSQSPLANAARLRGPLLLMASGRDRRVAISGVIEYAARLKHLGKDVSLIVDREAGHSNDDPLAGEAWLYLLEYMLARHLGGAASAPPDGSLRTYLDRNLLITGSGLSSR